MTRVKRENIFELVENGSSPDRHQTISASNADSPTADPQYARKEKAKAVSSRKRKTNDNDDDFVEPLRKERAQRKSPSNKPTSINEDAEEDIAFLNRVSPAGLLKMMKNLDDRQRELVREIGWGHILDLKLTRFPDHDLSEYLVKNFNCADGRLRLQHGNWLEINEDDVEACFGLPHGHMDIVEGKPHDESAEYKALLEELRADFDLPPSKYCVNPSRVQHFILTGQSKKTNDCQQAHKLYGDKFKRYFVLQAVSSIFARTKAQGCKYTLMKSLVNVEHINQYNWCKYIIKSLWKSIEKWKKKPHAHFDGPLVFLLICYMDRVAYMDLYADKRSFPIASNWTDEMAYERIRKEKSCEGFGAGAILPRIQIPTRFNLEGPRTAEITTQTNDEAMDLALRFQHIIVHRMGPLIKDLSALFEEAREYNVPGDSTFITFFKNYASMLNEMVAQPPAEKSTHQSHLQETENQSQGAYGSTQAQAFWNSKEVMDAIDEATLDLLSAKEKIIDGPNFDLGISFFQSQPHDEHDRDDVDAAANAAAVYIDDQARIEAENEGGDLLHIRR